MARTPLFERLPESWKYNDSKTSLVDGKGELQRYLEVWDDGFDRSEGLAESVLNTRDISRIPDRYLRLIGELVGHRWKDYRTYQWNRKRIRESISKYSYKGTYLSIADLAAEHGSSLCEIVDMASTVAVWSRQGALGASDSYFFDPDFHHPGVFIVYLSEDVDYDHFVEDFEYLKPAGTKWYIYIRTACNPSSITFSSNSELNVKMNLTPDAWVSVFNYSYHLPIPKKSCLVPHVVDMSERYVTWDSDTALFDDTTDVYI